MSPMRSHSNPVPAPSGSIPANPVPSVPPPTTLIQNDKLKELMASLNPAMLQGILAPPANSSPHLVSTTPMIPSLGTIPSAYQSYQGVGQVVNNLAYQPPYDSHVPESSQQGPWNQGRRDDRSRSPDKLGGGVGYGRGGPDLRQSDNGWTSGRY